MNRFNCIQKDGLWSINDTECDNSFVIECDLLTSNILETKDIQVCYQYIINNNNFVTDEIRDINELRFQEFLEKLVEESEIKLTYVNKTITVEVPYHMDNYDEMISFVKNECDENREKYENLDLVSALTDIHKEISVLIPENHFIDNYINKILISSLNGDLNIAIKNLDNIDTILSVSKIDNAPIIMKTALKCLIIFYSLYENEITKTNINKMKLNLTTIFDNDANCNSDAIKLNYNMSFI
jgi:hypothetical protein